MRSDGSCFILILKMSSSSATLDLTVGAIVVSSFFSFLTMGIVCVTAFYYVANFPNDTLPIKLIVLANVILCIAGTITDGVWCYDWAVTNYGNPASMAILPIPAIIEIFFVGLTSLLVQCFYSWRLWVITHKRNHWLPVAICILSVTQMSVIIWVVSYWANHRLMTDIGGVMPVAYIWLASSIAADLLITVGMSWYLKWKLPSSIFSSTLFNQIISRTVQANVLSLISQVLTFAFYKADIGLYFFLVDFTIVKVYTFSLLCSLNGRERNAAVQTRPRADSEVLTLGIMAAGTTSRASPTMHWPIKKDDSSVGEC
ncbi:uncharacterized protein EV420DRAFT_909700 [Desarmillaria tabescens]|uniref:DUF6534 domain-containing protein n=1 Tax=Armillaria tabescens TaxID=1929756 RepID=A0AA39JQJ8_ARMTA|nr:uncharacterized protein EV420DRAFT_909700 [Desarmillaria tabescens]KAK0445976.1 hypothetical protein EV420DRAFT_909700 [Desarmillaria tabescens]